MPELTRRIVPGNLRLTVAQENRLLAEAKERREQVRKDMGFGMGPTSQESARLGPQYYGWLAQRKEAWESYYNDFSYRENTKYSALFKLYNSSVNVPKRAARMFKARAMDAMTGIAPMVSLEPEGEEDADPAVKHAQRFFNFKLDEAKIKQTLRRATEQACVSGEAVMKIARKNKKVGPSRGRVFVHGGQPDPATGEVLPLMDVVDSAGEPVKENDAWEADGDLLGVERLKRDPETKKPPGARLSDDIRPFKQKPDWGDLDVTVIPYQDFIISPSAASIEAADYREHTIPMEEGEVRAYIAGSPLSEAAKQWLRTIHTADARPRAESQQPNPSQQERREIETVGIPKVLMAESWMRFDLNDDGEYIIEVCLFWDILNEYPVAYDYMEDATSLEGELPFKVVRIIESKNRWHGIGFYELLSNEHGFIDRQWNRIDSRSGTSGVFKWHKKGAIQELNRGLPLELNGPRVYTIDPSCDDPEKAFGFVELPKVDDNIWQMMVQAIQNAQTMSGTMQPSDSAGSDLNQSDTLGEQELLNQESDIMNGDIMQDLLTGVTATLQAACYVVFKNIVPAEANVLLSSEKASALLTWLQGKVAFLMYHLHLTLRKARNKQVMLANQQAIALVVGEGTSWIMLARTDPESAENVKSLYENILNCNEIPNVEKVLSIPQPLVMPPTDATAPIQQPPALPPAAAA